ncbi:hypothetical protein [Sulfitobacter sp. R18_1]|uniref:hypothetical protein n=1 Tax=Sulfitobacter sp. R18_1 TaxID=2821104 RepID=UPI001ADB01D3|nr:hypothetical protein [Sulfitobacter sp. R18_1]MBO9428675.1 hypothetical protein [Sulfitobacter sp. R18_1]
MRHQTHIDLYIDPTDDDMPYRLERPDVEGAYKVTYEIDEQSEKDNFPEAHLIVYDTPQQARRSKDLIEGLDGDAIVEVAQAPTGEGLLITSSDSRGSLSKVSLAISVVDRREALKEFPIDPSWEQHDFQLDFRSTKCSAPNASLIASIAHQAAALSADELETLHEKLSELSGPKPKI